MKMAKLGLAALTAIALMTPSCLTAEAYFGKLAPPKGQILRFWNAAEPRSIDPHKTAGVPEFNIISSLFEMLTVYDPQTLEPRPGVAERWEPIDQARKWIFYLRKNAVWTDGKPVTAHDFVWGWRRAVAPETASPYANLMYYVRNAEAISNGKTAPSALGVRAIDDYTFEVEMERPTAFFAKMTPHYIFAPVPHWAVEKWGDRWTDPEKIVSNGPFRLLVHKPYDRLEAVRNETYWDAANVKLEKVFFIPIEDQSTGLNLYKAGEVYTMQTGSVPLAFIKTLMKKKDYEKGTLFFTYYYALNVKRKPFDDVRVRKALNFAIDKRAITDQLIARGDVPATSFVPPGVPGYPQIKGPEYNPEEGRSLLAEAGYPDGKGFPKITIYFNTHEAHRQIAEAIQRMWKEELNIQSVELQNEEWQTFSARRERREVDVARDAWQGDYLDPSTFLDILATDSPNNHSGWVRPEYAKLLEEANAEPDEKRRFELLTKAEQMVIDEMPIIPIYYYGMSYLKKPFVDGWHSNLFDVHPLKFVSIREDWKPDSGS